MVEGEVALIRILMKMVCAKKAKILTLQEYDLLHYLKRDIVMECIDELSIDRLLDH
jgi:hypothetical protein